MKKQNQLDILFINPGSRSSVYQGLGANLSAIEPPILAALFAGYVRGKGLTTDIIDAPVANLGIDELVALVDQHYRATLIVIPVYGFQPSASTQNMTIVGELCRALKAKQITAPILLTGTHPAALPRLTMEQEAVDFVCDQEGPQTIYALHAQLNRSEADYSAVPNLWYRQGSEICSTWPGPLMVDLDSEMPMPAWDLLPMSDYRAHNWHCFEQIEQRQPYASIYTSLGCPYKCSFCCINAPFGKPSYRMWSPEVVVRQIDTLVNEYGVKNIKISDEMFVLNAGHVLGICDLLIERGYDLNIWAYARVDTVKDEYLDKLFRAGFRWLALGIESASKHVRDGVEKGRFGDAQIIDTVRRIQAAGINVIGNYIFGLPDDTQESMQQTLELALAARCEFANFYSAMAYPGSPLYRQAEADGPALPDSWVGYSQHSYECLPLATQTLSAAEVLSFRDQAFQRYFADEHYLAYVAEKFGPEVVMHIKTMAAVPLKRKIYSF